MQYSTFHSADKNRNNDNFNRMLSMKSKRIIINEDNEDINKNNKKNVCQVLFFEYDSTAAAFAQDPIAQDRFDSFVAACSFVYCLLDLQFGYSFDLVTDSAFGTITKTSIKYLCFF